jgi:hypothetical protein
MTSRSGNSDRIVLTQASFDLPPEGRFAGSGDERALTGFLPMKWPERQVFGGARKNYFESAGKRLRQDRRVGGGSPRKESEGLLA